MKRKAVGIWNCSRCKKTVAGGAWVYRYVSKEMHRNKKIQTPFSIFDVRPYQINI